MEIRTRRWTRSPRGLVLGVVTGLAEWRGLPVNLTRLVVLLIFMSTAFFPALIAYLLVALVLPEQSRSDIVRERAYEGCGYCGRNEDDVRRRYENLKRKVEGMENDLFDREKAWDAHFKAETAS